MSNFMCIIFSLSDSSLRFLIVFTTGRPTMICYFRNVIDEVVNIYNVIFFKYFLLSYSLLTMKITQTDMEIFSTTCLILTLFCYFKCNPFIYHRQTITNAHVFPKLRILVMSSS